MVSRRVLVVDDEPILLRMFCRHLKRLGFDVTAAADLQSARYAAGCGAFGVVVTDYHLAGDNGLDLIEDLKELLPDATLILMSGDPTVEESACRRGLTGLQAQFFSQGIRQGKDQILVERTAQ